MASRKGGNAQRKPAATAPTETVPEEIAPDGADASGSAADTAQAEGDAAPGAALGPEPQASSIPKVFGVAEVAETLVSVAKAIDTAVAEISDEPVTPAARIERFEAKRPDGTVLIVTRNIDTGTQVVTEK